MQILVLKQAIENDGTGAERKDAVYKPVQVIMDIAGSQGSIVYRPYHSAAALAAGADPVSQCEHNVHLDALHFMACGLLEQAAGQFSPHVSDALIRITPQVKDVDSGEKDAAGNPVLTPYFANAVPVLINVPDPPGMAQLYAAAAAMAAAAPSPTVEAVNG